jgi:hypothetical protein
MPLTEAQIQRYARHILLPEVGGVGQERLLAAEVRAAGEAPLVELATDYLRAAGVTCDAHSGHGLAIEWVGPSQSAELPGVTLSGNGAEVEVRSSACRQCRGPGRGPVPPEAGLLGAALAASEVLRLVLGLGGSERLWRVRGTQLCTGVVAPCPHRAEAP